MIPQFKHITVITLFISLSLFPCFLSAQFPVDEPFPDFPGPEQAKSLGITKATLFQTGSTPYKSAIFDPNGNKINEKTFDEHGKVKSEMITTFDASGNPLTGINITNQKDTIYSVRTWRKDGTLAILKIDNRKRNLKTTTTFLQDGNKKLISESRFNDSGGPMSDTRYEYDNRGNLQAKVTLNHPKLNVWTDTYNYNDQNQVISHQHTTHTKEAKMIVSTSDQYKYDEEGRLSEFMSQTSYQEGAITGDETTSYRYDDQGQLILKIRRNNALNQDSTWKYEYDKNGLLIQRTYVAFGQETVDRFEYEY